MATTTPIKPVTAPTRPARDISKHDKAPAKGGRVLPLDGLRTLAILGVVLYHLHVPGMKGGFVGVNVFFVLSGYLITSLLLEEHRREATIRLGRFWVRRILRLYPSLVAVVVVAAALWFLVGDYGYSDVGAGSGALDRPHVHRQLHARVRPRVAGRLRARVEPGDGGAVLSDLAADPASAALEGAASQGDRLDRRRCRYRLLRLLGCSLRHALGHRDSRHLLQPGVERRSAHDGLRSRPRPDARTRTHVLRGLVRSRGRAGSDSSAWSRSPR